MHLERHHLPARVDGGSTSNLPTLSDGEAHHSCLRDMHALKVQVCLLIYNTSYTIIHLTAARPIIEPPALPELLRLGVLKAVGPHYSTFGILLLNDTTGSRVATMECNNSPERITRKILQEWLEGKGLMPVSWETLVKTLRDIELNALADKIQQKLCTH